jgi:hypothetical protein
MKAVRMAFMADSLREAEFVQVIPAHVLLGPL